VICYRCQVELSPLDTVQQVEVKPKPSAVARMVMVHLVCPDAVPAVVEEESPDEPEGYVESERVWGYPEDE